MKKRWVALGVLALFGAGGYWGFQANKYRLPGIIQDWRDPVQPNRPVVWQQGPATAPTGKRPPNIILIVADDLGHGDLSAYGGTIRTPNIDALARSGIRYDTAYSTAPICSPSRAGFLSGRFQGRFRPSSWPRRGRRNWRTMDG